MRELARSISGSALLALGGACMFAGALFIYVEREANAQSEAITDPFLLGEYYFNADDDPTGPYDLVKARFYYTEAISGNPVAYPAAWYQLGRIDFLEGRFVSALDKFDRQIEYFEDGVPNVYYMIGLASGYKAQITNEAEDWDRAEAGFKEYLVHDPESPWAHVDLAWVYFSKGQYEEMLAVTSAGLAFHPDHAWLLNMHGLALMNTGVREEALTEFIRAKEAAQKLSTLEWGRAYPGNDPAEWDDGLLSFKEAIDKNIELAKPRD